MITNLYLYNKLFYNKEIKDMALSPFTNAIIINTDASQLTTLIHNYSHDNNNP